MTLREDHRVVITTATITLVGYSDSGQTSIKGLFFLFENETTLVTLLYSRSIGETFGCNTASVA